MFKFVQLKAYAAGEPSIPDLAMDVHESPFGLLKFLKMNENNLILINVDLEIMLTVVVGDAIRLLLLRRRIENEELNDV